MPQLSRKGDANQAGGKIIRGAATVFANGIPVGLHVSPITPHGPGRHKRANTTEGSPTVITESCQTLRVTSGNDCGHSIVQGSPDVFCP